MDNLLHMMRLVHEKNEINRKRRRFYHIMVGNRCSVHKCKKRGCDHVIRGGLGYEKYAAEGKKLGLRLRYIREAMGAKFMWGDSGNIQAVTVGDKTIRAKDFIRYYNDACAEQYLLGGRSGKES